jgi:hypothetical protein
VHSIRFEACSNGTTTAHVVISAESWTRHVLFAAFEKAFNSACASLNLV